MKGDLNGKICKFNSGDLLFFDASLSAKVNHGIISIDDNNTSPNQLKLDYRLGFQMRLFK